jgi:IS5 family transposase
MARVPHAARSGHPSAREASIAHARICSKEADQIDRNWLKGALGDAIHAVLCGAGHNLRMILRKLRLFCALVLFALLNRSTAQPLSSSRHEG